MGSISASDKAKAAEALNRQTSLSPAARRLGIELLNRTDKRTGICWPSEARLAEALGYTIRTINRAKRELRIAGFVSWESRGQHMTPIYRLAWEILKTLALAIKAKMQAAFTPAPVKQTRNNAPKAGNKISQNIASLGKPSTNPDRTFSSAYPRQVYNKARASIRFSTVAGTFKTPGTPPRQILSDQQHDNRGSTRLYAALQSLGNQFLEAFIAHPKAAELEAAAIKAERFAPRGTPPGQAAINYLRGALAC